MIKVIPFNENYYTPVCNLLYEYREILSDDYIKLDSLTEIMKLVTKFKDSSFVALEDDKFIGFLYFYDIYGSETKNHSCFIMGCFKRKVHPDKTREASRKFITKLYDDYDFIKIQAKANKFNKASIRIIKDLGFKPEGSIWGDTMKNGQLQIQLIFGKINKKYYKKYRR